MPKFLLFFLCSIQCCFSQTDKNIEGIVISDGILLAGVDVINDRSRTSQITNTSGHFSILAQVGDTLIFHSTNYQAKKIRIKEADFGNPNFKISLYKKIEELEEVIISNNVQPVLISKHIVNNRYFGDSKSALTNPYMYTAEIAEAPDLVKIASLVAKVFKKPRDVSESKPVIGFREFVNSSYDRAYLKKTFQLKDDEVSLFLEFCEADAKANSVKESGDKMALLELMIRKNEEFKRLGRD